MEPGGPWGRRGLKVGCAGRGAYHLHGARGRVSWRQAWEGKKSRFFGGWGTLGWGPVLPRSSFSGKETEGSENSNFELGLPGHCKGIFVKLRDCRCFHCELGL